MENIKLENCLNLSRDAFAQNEAGEDQYSYSVFGKGRGGKEIQARVKLDKFYYHQADAYFGTPEDNFPLYLRRELNSFTDAKTGEVKSSTTYIAFTVDEEGYAWSLPVMPFGKSDALTIDVLFDRIEWEKNRKKA